MSNNKNKSCECFWRIISLLDWQKPDNDNEVLEPAVDYLSKKDDAFIFAFDENMAELLFAIDGKKWAKDYVNLAGYFSDDGFLYCRLATIAKGKDYFERVEQQKVPLDGSQEFERLLYLPRFAWAKKHNKDIGNYPYLTKTNFESGSNNYLWNSGD